MTKTPACRRRAQAPIRHAGRAPSGTHARRRHPGLTVAARRTSIDSTDSVFPNGPVVRCAALRTSAALRATADSLPDRDLAAPARVGANETSGARVVQCGD